MPRMNVRGVIQCHSIIVFHKRQQVRDVSNMCPSDYLVKMGIWNFWVSKTTRINDAHLSSIEFVLSELLLSLLHVLGPVSHIGLCDHSVVCQIVHVRQIALKFTIIILWKSWLFNQSLSYYKQNVNADLSEMSFYIFEVFGIKREPP